VVRTIAYADKVFDSHDNAMGWLRESNEDFDSRTAFQMLTTEVGGAVVRSILHQIDEGIHSVMMQALFPIGL